MKPSRRSSFLILLVESVLALAVAGSFGAPAAQAQKITVESADPPMGEQGTVNLDVRIKGKGFKSDSVAAFLVTGTANPGGIVVKSTQFISATELIANVDIDEAAELASFDIVVQSNGRTGKGIELFRVTQKGGGGNTTSCLVPQPSLTTTLSCTSVSSGCLDTTLGGTGAVFVDTDSGSGADSGTVVLVQSDGKVLVVGEGGLRGAPTHTDGAALRFHMDGGLDQSFGNGGIALITISPYTDEVHSALLQPDGKILIGGSSGGGYFAVVRLNPDGSPDAAFGTNGVSVVDFGRKGGKVVWGLALQNDGKVVAVGSGGPDWSITRLNPDGTLDTSFANRGLLIAKSGGGAAEAVKIQTVMVNGSPVERILVAGRGWASGTTQVALMRFTLSGDFDTSFGPAGTGKVTTQFCSGSGGYPRGLEFDAQGRIVVGGVISIPEAGSDYEFLVARYTSNGILDTSFGAPLPGSTQRAGYNVVDFLGDWDQVYGTAIQADGRIVLSGYILGPNGSFTGAGLARFNPDGSLDSTFGNNGLAVGSAAFRDWGFRMGLDAYGRILVAGRAIINGLVDIGLYRFWP